jgi:excisionase family DNA binding protein
METDNERIMTVRDLAGYLRVHPSTIYRQLRFGLLPAFRVGSDWRFKREAIDRWCLDSTSAEARSERTPHEASARSKGAGART